MKFFRIKTDAFTARKLTVIDAQAETGVRLSLWTRCAECGEEFEAAHIGQTWTGRQCWRTSALAHRVPDCYEVDGHDSFVCPDCRENFATCDDCGSLERTEDLYTVAGERAVCDCCYDEYVVCEHCGELIRREEMLFADGRWFCNDYCANAENVYACDDCGEWFHIDDMIEDDYGNVLCDRCARDHVDDDEDASADWIMNYHGSRRNGFNHYGNDSRRVGIELEVERAGSDTACGDMAARIDGIMNVFDRHVQFEHDSSLNNGFEIVTDAHTVDAWNATAWRDMLEALQAAGYRSHDPGTCGLHVHLSRAWFESEYAVANMVDCYTRFYDDLARLARRNVAGADRWARRNDSDKNTVMEKYTDNVDACDRYRAVNLTNPDTVEIRLGRGTLNADSFEAWLDIVTTIARNANSIPLDNEYVTLSAWLYGISDSTRAYCDRRGVRV